MAHVHPPPTPTSTHSPSSLSFGFGAALPRTTSPASSMHHPAPVGFGSFKRPAFAPPLQHTFALPPPQSPSSPFSPFGGTGTRPAGGGEYFSPSSQQQQGQPFGSSPLKQQHRAFFPQSPAVSTSTSTSHSQQPNPRRRGREDDDEGQGRAGSSMEDFAMDGAGGSEGRVVRGMKKSRRVANEETGDGQGKGAASNGSSQEGEVDVGVLLALLPQTSLLPILSSLLQLHPSLKPDLLKLIPTPSISTTLDSLRAAESKVKEAVPFGWSKGAAGAGVSESYVLGRINGPIGELAAQISTHLPFFTSNPSPPHPTLSYPYLLATTSLLLSLSSLLPSPLHPLSILWPRLAEEWLAWVGRVSQLVNQEGGMVGSGVAEGWIKGLDELAGGGAGLSGKGVGELEERIRREMGVVRERWVGQVGWLVGRRIESLPINHTAQYHHNGQPPPHQQHHSHDMMEEEEEL